MSASVQTSFGNPSTVTKAVLISLALLPFAIMTASNGYAVSRSVKSACKNDYFAHCSAHAVGTPGLRKCMRSVGKRLSPTCVKALVRSGEVSKAELARHK
jgi:hypothetical protein